MTADLHVLMQRFARLPDAQIGRGPKHPTEPQPALASTVEEFLSYFPFLRRDQDYVDFLECYAGASAFSPNHPDFVIDLFGFTDVSSILAYKTADGSYVAEEGHIVDDKGYFAFCDGLYSPDTSWWKDKQSKVKLLGCCFDASGKREQGVYRVEELQGETSSMYWYCDTFLKWLEVLIETKGDMPQILS